MKKALLLVLASLMGSLAFADQTMIHAISPEQSKLMAEHNERMAAQEMVNGLFGAVNKNIRTNNAADVPVLPFAEYHETGYVFFSDQITFESLEVKRAVAKNLPEGVTLVVYTGISNKSAPEMIYQAMAPFIARDRMKVIYLPTAKRGFWARDGVPVPVFQMDDQGNQDVFTVVDAKYTHGFEADKIVADLFGAAYFKHEYFHEGGNFAFNAKGDCMVVDNERAIKIPDDTFRRLYGCQTMLRLPFIKGIGHADESVKFISDDTVLVDNDTYERLVQRVGFKTLRLPTPKNPYENYTNSLLVNGTIFVPIFNQPTDAEALKVYNSLGFKVIPLNTSVLSNQGLGSIHCITMNYPATVDFQELVRSMGGQEL